MDTKVKKAVKRKAVKKSQEVKIVLSYPQASESQIIEPFKENNKLSLTTTWMSEKQSLRLMQRTPDQYKYTRPGKGGQNFTYVPVSYVIKALNFTFGWLWDFNVVSKEIFGLSEGIGHIIVQGRLTVKDSKGQSITKEQFGQAEVKYLKGTKNPLNLGNDFKAAASDALKKCASEIGIASDVYGVNEFREIKSEVENTKEIPLLEKIERAIGSCNSIDTLVEMSKKIGENKELSLEEQETLKNLISSKIDNIQR